MCVNFFTFSNAHIKRNIPEYYPIWANCMHYIISFKEVYQWKKINIQLFYQILQEKLWMNKYLPKVTI